MTVAKKEAPRGAHSIGGCARRGRSRSAPDQELLAEFAEAHSGTAKNAEAMRALFEKNNY